MTDPFLHSNAIEHHAPRFRLNVDEWVCVIAIVLLAFGLVFGATHQQSLQVASCYSQTTPRP